jgi:hypothetical protein
MSKPARPLRWTSLAAVTAALALLPHAERSAKAGLLSLDDADRAITQMEVDKARSLLASHDPQKPLVGLLLGKLALTTGDCDAAAHFLGNEQVQKLPDVGALLTVARGCARAMAGTVVVEDAAHGVIVRLQDDADRAIVPLIGEVIAKQRDVLERDLGVKMPIPARVDVVRDQFSLGAMTGLPHKAAQTTGTVAIAKFGRVIVVSPRAPELGYALMDTVAHEYTHLALARGTLDGAPLWLQEGVAKREETRWRPAAPTDEAIPADAVAAAGLAQGLGRPLDGIGPSVALLPSAREAMVVYAEVQSFVRFLAGDRVGAKGAPTDSAMLPRLVKAYSEGLDTDAALKKVSGRDLKEWNAIWRPWVATQGKPLPASVGLDPKHGAAPHGASAGAAGANPEKQARALRLGELLLGRDHAKAARVELDPLAPLGLDDALVGARVALARLRAGDLAGARAALVDPVKLIADLGAWWATRGDVLAEAKAGPEVEAAYRTAVAHDPLSEQAACGWAGAAPAGDPIATVARDLCAAAKERAAPSVGRD